MLSCLKTFWPQDVEDLSHNINCYKRLKNILSIIHNSIYSEHLLNPLSVCTTFLYSLLV